MKNIKILSMFLVIMFLFVLSSSLVFAETDAQTRKIAEPMMGNILQAMKNRDYNQYVKKFDPEMKKAATKARFIVACDFVKTNFGDYVSRKFFEIEKKDGYVKVVWKAKYSKAKRVIQMELVLKKYNNKWLIAGQWFR
ncbi:MAG: DUF3887 domain-containing protein [Candidatus Eremiobacteraeota bacterium]|nr:DUF3887 domain-containing protein [Candidatus Eremiobacteraeota bacterium]